MKTIQNSLAHQLGAVVLVADRRLCTVVPPVGFCTACRICVGADGRLTLPLQGAEVAAAAERRGPTESVCPAGLAQGADADGGAAALLEQVDRHVSPAMPWEDAARSLLQVFCQETGADAAAVVLCEVEAPAAHGRARVIAHNLSQSFVNDFLSNPLLGCNPDVEGQGVALDRETGFAPPFNHPQVEAEGIAALVAAPLPLSIARGVLYLFAFQPTRFRALSPTRAALMAREAARLYNAGRLSAELRVRRQTTHAIRDLLLVAGADRQTVAARLRSLVTAGLGMPYCGLFIREDEGDRLSDLAAGDAPAAHPHLRRLAEDCFLSGRTIEADDVEERAAFRAGAGRKARAEAFDALLCLRPVDPENPLRTASRRAGPPGASSPGRPRPSPSPAAPGSSRSGRAKLRLRRADGRPTARPSGASPR